MRLKEMKLQYSPEKYINNIVVMMQFSIQDNVVKVNE
jgi:hypothetical protein